MDLFRNPTFVVATGIGACVGLGMFSAISFLPTFLQMTSGTSAAVSGLLMTPMVAGIALTIHGSAAIIPRTGRYKVFPIVGVGLSIVAVGWMTTLSGETPLWTVGCMIFLIGAGMGLVMQNVVLAAQNAVSPHVLGAATATNNYVREAALTLGVAVFGTLFTSRLAASLTAALGANPSEAAAAGIPDPETLVPAAVQRAAEPLQSAIVDAYAHSLAPVFGYLLPVLLVAFVLALALKEVPLSEVSGMVARGEALAATDPAAPVSPSPAPVHTAALDPADAAIRADAPEVSVSR
jgi:hypothetical protein